MTSRVTVIIPLRNEAQHLPQMLEGLARQDFDRARLFVIAVDGESSDESAQIVSSWLQSNGISGRIVVNSARTIPAGLNAGLRAAAPGDIILRLDARSVCGPSYISKAVAALEAAPQDVACVGTAQVPQRARTFEGRVVESLYTNLVGLGAPDFRHGEDERFVDSVYCAVWRPGVLQRAGGFDEAMIANEDSEISARVRAMGYRILRVPLPCRYIIKRGVIGTIRQWATYGYWRSKTLRRHREAIRMRHAAAPAAMLVTLLLLLSPIRWIVAILYAVYAVLIVRHRDTHEAWYITVLALGFFPLVQAGYACGLLFGAISGPIEGMLPKFEPHFADEAAQ